MWHLTIKILILWYQKFDFVISQNHTHFQVIGIKWSIFGYHIMNFVTSQSGISYITKYFVISSQIDFLISQNPFGDTCIIEGGKMAHHCKLLFCACHKARRWMMRKRFCCKYVGYQRNGHSEQRTSLNEHVFWVRIARFGHLDLISGPKINGNYPGMGLARFKICSVVLR